MTTNFFEQLIALQVQGNWKMTIQQDGERLIVSILLVDDKIGDEARKMIPPMILKGTAQEIDAGFFDSIKEPVQQTAVLFANMEHYLKQLDEAKAQSAMEKDKETKERKEKDERKKKFAETMKKVDDLDEKKQYQLAIATLPKTDQFPEQAEEINKRLEELRNKNGQLTLM